MGYCNQIGFHSVRGVEGLISSLASLTNRDMASTVADRVKTSVAAARVLTFCQLSHATRADIKNCSKP